MISFGVTFNNPVSDFPKETHPKLQTYLFFGFLGVRKYIASGEVPDKLCALCAGTGDDKCSSDSEKNMYAGYHGAFKCMADGKGDVAFAKHTTTEEVVKLGNRGGVSDYQYLCKDGSRKGET